ncbi:MAG TPA: PEGA domain-containing protein [Spirochaetales bacterium]|nr:PEGA domain-containing protein [Spirochaetales bacterium]HPM73659.1 PEGA domain-containing protein [Spirochaetales bacterium]
MRRPSARGLACIVAFSAMLAPAARVSAQASSGTDVSSSALTIGWAELAVSDGVGDEYRNAAVLVPRQLQRALAFADLRFPSDVEAAAASTQAALAAEELARKAVADARAKRDLAALAVRDPAKRGRDVATAAAAVKKAEAALEAILATNRETNRVRSSADRAGPGSTTAEGRSLALALSSANSGETLLPSTLDPASLCKDKKLDLLVYGSLRVRGGFLAIDLSLYVASLGRAVWTETRYASADGLGQAVAAFSRPLAEAVIGRPYARVGFRVEPPDADLYVDGEAFPKAFALYFEPGRSEVVAKARGYERVGRSFDVSLGEDLFVDLSLEAQGSVGWKLTSEPEGAAIHLDGERVGYAPFDLPGSAFPRLIRVSMPGFEPVQLVHRPEALLDDLTIVLEPDDGLSFDERYDRRKDAFYRSLGWFVSSLPLTVLSGGLFQTYYATAQGYSASGEVDPEVIRRLDSAFYTSQAVFWASAAASIGCAVWAVVRLVAYIEITL